MNSLRRAIDRFCVLHPHFGIPNLMRYIVIGNVLVYLLSSFSQYSALSFYNALAFNLTGLLHGEVWRLVTFLFVPNVSGGFMLLITCYFYYWIGGTLEREWGTAKFNIYYISGAVLTLLATSITALLMHNPGYSVYGAYYINMAMFFAFAALYPDAQVLLFFFIPIKIKYLAYLDAALFAYDIFASIFGGYWVNALLPVMALLNFFVFFAPEVGSAVKRERVRGKQSARFHNDIRQAQREQRAQGYRHKCSVCGRTDTDHPELQFRYCSKCAGYHCFCADHIFNHVHFTEEP